MLLAHTAWRFILLHELLRAGLKLDNVTFRVQNVTFQETDTNYFPGMDGGWGSILFEYICNFLISKGQRLRRRRGQHSAAAAGATF